MKSCNSMSRSFSMPVCLYVSAHKNSSSCTDFYGIFYWGVYKNLLMFQFLFKQNIDTSLKTCMNFWVHI